MKIVDCFTFYNELDLLYYRLNLLYDYVDYFILIEANATHAGHAKPMYYADNMHLFKKFHSKIIHMVADLPFKAPNIDYSKNEQWVNENFQRNCIKQCVQMETVGLSNSDLVMISDLDELIDPQRLVEFRDGSLLAYKGFTLSQDMYYYNLHCKNTWFWGKAKIVTYEYLLQNTPEQLRQGELPLLERSGWHLSYFGDVAFIRNKLLEFGHQEYNSPDYTDETIIAKRLENCADLFGRGYVHMIHMSVEHNYYLPPMYDIYLNNYINRPDNPSSLPIYLYYHVCCIANWREIMSTMLFRLKNSGLYHYLSQIRVTVLGNEYNPHDPLFCDPKIVIRFYSADTSLFERPCLNGMIEDAKNEDFYVLYMHSKGVMHWTYKERETNVHDWSAFMMYFNVYRHITCIHELNNGASAVGCNLQEFGAPLHYSGNFWWSKSNHVKQLPTIVDTYYNTPEFLVTSIDGVYKSLWHSGVNHYNEPYPSKKYENQPVTVKTVERKNGVV